MRDRVEQVSNTSFESFFVANEPTIRRALVAAFGPEVGREAAAECLTYGWEHWPRLAGMDNPAGYLYRVGERWAKRKLSRRQRIQITFPESERYGFEPGLDTALESLTMRQRQAVLMVHGQGLTHQEAADLLNIKRSSIQNHTERGLAKLRKHLGVRL